MKDLSRWRFGSTHLMVLMIVVLGFVISAAELSGQTKRRRASTPIPAPTATPYSSEPQIISRADEFPDQNSRAIPPDPNELKSGAGANSASVVSLEDLGNRIKNLEAGQQAKPVDKDEKQKRLLLNLDILARAEQRSESLRKQVFEMIERENTIKTRLDALDYDLRPEVLERSTALIGSLRPEEIRASRRNTLQSERTNLQNLLTEIQRTRGSLESGLVRADALVEKLRTRFEKEIDTALEEDPDDRPEN
ncbi:MAG TPA: hypothetical protein VMZ26_02030 [Pyrinomonadaceae bacterium]|nr:hypothetical protein [Pyrinomonadaceae bacterium]